MDPERMQKYIIHHIFFLKYYIYLGKKKIDLKGKFGIMSMINLPFWLFRPETPRSSVE